MALLQAGIPPPAQKLALLSLPSGPLQIEAATQVVHFVLHYAEVDE